MSRLIQTAGVVSSVGLLALGAAAQKPFTTWRTMGGTPDSSNYSSLTQINRSNVDKLQVAWTYDSGDHIGYNSAPIEVDGVLYAPAREGSLVALNAATGKEIWVHKFPAPPGGPVPVSVAHGPGLSGYRGLNYWENKDRTDRRIMVQVDGYLEAIDAKTGKTVDSFGNKGRVDIKTGMTRPFAASTTVTRTPGQIFENTIILGAATGEAYGSPPADIRAFDVVSGSLAWVFHTIPHPGEYGYETWPKDAWTYSGGAGTWGEMSIDEKRGIAYIPTGTPKYEFWGGDRHGDTLFADCILALDARTGKRLWHFQTVHHDVWEYEIVAAPQLLTVQHDGKAVDVVAVASKSGFLYVLDRVTGKPIWPIEERRVPPSDVPGELLSPTQPFPTKPPAFERMTYTVDDIDKQILTDAERKRWTDIVSKARNEGIFTPFSLNYFTIMVPGHSGGANLYASSSDPETGTTYVISHTQPALERLYTTAVEASKYIGHSLYGPGVAVGDPEDGLQVFRRAEGGRGGGRGAQASDAVMAQGRAMYQQTCQQCHGANLAAESGAAPPLTGVVDRIGVDSVRAVIREGRGPMPTFATMAESDLAALVAYLRNPTTAAGGRGAASRSREAAPYPPGVDVPQRLFTTYGMVPAHVVPPYSRITAYDLNTGTIKWQVPYGEAIGVNPPGNNFGILEDHGPKARLAVTAGGLAFSATIERKVRAFDKDTGKVLWVQSLPDGAEGSPAVYEVDGREYVAIGIRGSLITYALPAGVK